MKEFKEAIAKGERVDKRVEEAISKATVCRKIITENWKASEEGKIFLEDASIEASQDGHTEALKKVLSLR